MKIKIYFLLLLFLLPIYFGSAQEVTGIEKEYVLLYDESHDQYFTSEMMKTALDSLSDALNVTINIKINTEEFTATSLQGADILLVTNPGEDINSNLNSEKLAIDTYIRNGGGVMYLSNPFSYDQNITGQGQTINSLIGGGLEGKMTVSAQDVSNVSLIVDDFNNDGNDTHIIVNSSNFNDDVFTTELNNLTGAEILVYSGFVGSTDPTPDYYANTSELAYGVDQNYDIVIEPTLKNRPRWMEAVSIEEEGRAMLVGSTIMFSDALYDNSTGAMWVDQKSNLELFQNFVAWLLQITPLDEESEIIGQSFAWFVTYNVLIAFSIVIFLLFVWIGSLIKSGKLPKSKIFDMKLPKPEKKKSKKKTKNKKKNKRKRT